MGGSNNKTTYSAQDFNVSVDKVIQDFITYGDELSSLNEINEEFFCGTPSAINSPVLGVQLYDLWKNNITNDLGNFVSAYNSWIAQLEAEGRVLDEFTRNQVDLFKKAEIADTTAKEQVASLNTSASVTEDAVTSSTLSYSGMSKEESDIWSKATTADVERVTRFHDAGGDVDTLSDKDKVLYKVISKNSKVEGAGAPKKAAVEQESKVEEVDETSVSASDEDFEETDW